MELLYLIGIIVGFYFAVAIAGWLIKEVEKFRETRRYKAKLKNITPQIDSINIEELFSKLSTIKQSYLSLQRLLERKYKVSEKNENVKAVYQYAQEEADYRRSKRKPAKKTYRRKRRRYY
jgi:hypothetical protein